MRTLYIVRGLPGSGKSTFAKCLVPTACIFEADKFWYDVHGNYAFDINRLHIAHQWCQKQVEGAMIENLTSNGQYFSDIVVSNTNTTEKELEVYLTLANKYEYKIVSLIVENRHGGKSIHNVPDEIMEKMKNRFTIKL